MRTRLLCLLTLYLSLSTGGSVAVGAELPQTIETVKASVVGIGTLKKTRSPAIAFAATGFAVDDGLTVVTNAHAIPDTLDTENMETLGIVTGGGADFRAATLIGIDREHDIALLRLEGAPLPALKLGDSATAREGQSFAFTGFPLGMVLGLHHATHRAMLAAITPIVLPAANSHKLDVKMIVQLQRSPFYIFQLDGTAYPGNSGSPLYDPETGVVYGIINMTYVKGLKETAITAPSGITYAIPSNFIRDFLQQKK